MGKGEEPITLGSSATAAGADAIIDIPAKDNAAPMSDSYAGSLAHLEVPVVVSASTAAPPPEKVCSIFLPMAERRRLLIEKVGIKAAFDFHTFVNKSFFLIRPRRSS
jgi:hypothetical protein